MTARDWDEDAARFERTPNTKHGNGSARAANKSKVKRALKGYGAVPSKRKRRS